MLEDTDQAQNIKRPYNFAYHELFKDLPSVGKGGGRGLYRLCRRNHFIAARCHLSSYTGDALEELASKTGILLFMLPITAIALSMNCQSPHPNG